MHSRTLKDRQGSKPSPRTEQPSSPRSTESVRHSGGPLMKTPHRGRFIPCEGDTQLFKQAPGRMVDVEAVQAFQEGGASPFGGGPQMKPHNRQRRTRGRR